MINCFRLADLSPRERELLKIAAQRVVERYDRQIVVADFLVKMAEAKKRKKRRDALLAAGILASGVGVVLGAKVGIPPTIAATLGNRFSEGVVEARRREEEEENSLKPSRQTICG